MDFQLTLAQKDLRCRAHELGGEWYPHAAEWDVLNHVPLAEMTRRAGEYGLLALTMPKEHGGHDLSTVEYAVVVGEVIRASACWAAGEPMFRTSGAGPSICLMSDNDVPRSKFLPDIISGTRGCALTLTEPAHGSDITCLETTAVRDGDDYVLNGSKRLITGAIEDELYATFVRMGDTPGARGIGAVNC